ncbi:MAG: (2Fe-2S) ferredoxin domain-containing protein [Pseudomonadota bacterium]|nr:(2Fe-2S) ferredoxin domain-containing protein [Pseudomonadota bacterium]
MEQKPIKFEKHIFVCTNTREDGRECCAQKGSEELRKKLKEWVKSDSIRAQNIKVSKSGCLSHCEEGIAVVIYPEQKWLTKIQTSDLESIKTLLLKKD